MGGGKARKVMSRNRKAPENKLKNHWARCRRPTTNVNRRLVLSRGNSTQLDDSRQRNAGGFSGSSLQLTWVRGVFVTCMQLDVYTPAGWQNVW